MILSLVNLLDIHIKILLSSEWYVSLYLYCLLLFLSIQIMQP